LVRRCPRRRKALVVGWPRWFPVAVLLGLEMGYAQGDDGGARSGNLWLAAWRHGSPSVTAASRVRGRVEQSEVGDSSKQIDQGCSFHPRQDDILWS
jgi:hypothetical protein